MLLVVIINCLTDGVYMQLLIAFIFRDTLGESEENVTYLTYCGAQCVTFSLCFG